MNLSNALFIFSGQKSKELFTINKVAGIANAIVNTAEGVTNALRSVPYPANIFAAASTAAMGAVQIATIASTSMDGGGGVSTPSGGIGGYGDGTPQSPVVTQTAATQQTGPTQVTVHIQTDKMMADKQAMGKWLEEEFAPLMKEAVSRNVNFGVTTN
jgi:hypothetical protein